MRTSSWSRDMNFATLIFVGLIVLAIIAVVLAKKAQTTSVISDLGSTLAGIIRKAANP